MKEKKKVKLPRGVMPPPSKRFKDRKKESNKKACRKFNRDKRED